MSIYEDILERAYQRTASHHEREAVLTKAHFANHPECLHPIVSMDTDGLVRRDHSQTISVFQRCLPGWLEWLECEAKQNKQDTLGDTHWLIPRHDEDEFGKVVALHTFLPVWTNALQADKNVRDSKQHPRTTQLPLWEKELAKASLN